MAKLNGTDGGPPYPLFVSNSDLTILLLLLLLLVSLAQMLGHLFASENSPAQSRRRDSCWSCFGASPVGQVAHCINVST